jgi:hypothetical protein
MFFSFCRWWKVWALVTRIATPTALAGGLRRRHFMRNSRRITFAVIAALASMGVGRWASADVIQDLTVDGDATPLANAGYGGLNGTNINVGVIEAGGGLANISNAGGANEPLNTNLVDGNPDLPNNVLLY